MSRKLLQLLCAYILGFLAISKAHASVTFVWSSEVELNAFNSDGTTALNADFLAQIGIFESGFVPDATNRSEWMTRWASFGSVPYNDVDDYFSGSVEIASNAAAPIGSQIYLWIRNDSVDPAEWFIATNDASDGSTANDWVIPDIATTDQTTRPIYFDLRADTAGDLTVLFGKTTAKTGAGEFESTPGSFTIQTHAIPEPNSLVLLLLVSALAQILTRSRRKF